MADPAQQKRGRTANDTAQDLERVTDYVQEEEVDPEQAAAAVKLALNKDSEETQDAKAKRAKELAAVTISKDDVALIVKEMEMDADTAELKLRENKGDVVLTLRAMMA
eukprot:TRINITY_DN15261_c0_g1_i1.p1 TRINITY_DN15261_c0_g1~~TRINITY_DN15261_c0_g1_i1.p1  ORF type:complete len:118 (-),score=46.68 TRINITY_DN15261_c0_g1_i1:15-338(-)